MSWNRYSADFELSSSQYAYVADNAALSITGDISIEAWVNFESLPANGTGLTLPCKQTGTSNQRSYYWSLWNKGGTYIVRAMYSTDGTYQSANDNYTLESFTFTPTVGTWYHLAWVVDTTNHSMKLYVNGSQQGSTFNASGTSIYNSTAHFTIGCYDGDSTPAGFFDGKFSNVRIFSDIRTQQEIQDNMYSILTGTSNNLVGSWYNDANDHNDDGGSNNLTASGSPVFSTNVPWTGANETDWSATAEIQADYTKVSGSADLTNYPALILDGNIPASIYSAMESDGKDLRITTDSAGANEVPFEIVSTTPASSLAEIHVKIPTLSYTANTSIYLWAGNANAIAYDANAPFGSQAVWSDYKAVYHLQSLTADSTVNAYTLTNTNTVASNTSSLIGYGADFGTPNTNKQLNTSSTLGIDGGQITISAWVYLSTAPSLNSFYDLFGQFNNNTNVGYYAQYVNVAGTYKIYCYRNRQGVAGDGFQTNLTLATGAWHKLTLTYDGTNLRFFADGVQVNTTTSTGNGTNDAGDQFKFGYSFGGGGYLAGKGDNLYVKPAGITVDWDATEYANQNAPSTFWVEVGTTSVKDIISMGFIPVPR